MKVTEKTKQSVFSLRKTIEDICDTEASNTRENIIERSGETEESKYDLLRYILFQLQLKDTARECAALYHCTELTNEDLDQMAKDTDMTIDQMISNAKKNVVMSVLEALLS